MKRLLLLLMVLNACSDAALTPNSALRLVIQSRAELIRETELLAGERILLTALKQEPGGRFGTADARWYTLDPGIATIDAQGWLTALRPGSTRVVATAGALADTIVVTILDAKLPERSCRAEEDGVHLPIGGFHLTRGSGAHALCLAGGAHYLLVPFHASTSNARLRLEARVEGVDGERRSTSRESRSDMPRGEPAIGSPDLTPRDLAPRELTSPDLGGFSPLDFDRGLREREVRDLGPRIRSRAAPLLPSFTLAPAALSIGETFLANVNAEETCSEPIERTMRVRAMGEHSIIATDTGNPAGDLDDAEYRQLAALFDSLIYPTITANFGEPTDIDGNGRVVILFTRAVNELTPRFASSYVAGFFYGRDLFPREDTNALRGCATSNVGEIIYLLAADPFGEVHGNRRSRELVSQRTLGVLAHELQHLISASRRLRVHRHERWNEEFWLNEGLSHVAEELAFYAASGLLPRSRIGAPDLQSMITSLQFDQFQAANFERLGAYLADPASTSPFADPEIPSRGAIWSFLRYAADRTGGSEEALWRAMIDTERTGYEKLLALFGASPLAWMHDWSVGLYLDGTAAPASPFQLSSWNARSLAEGVLGADRFPPVRAHSLTWRDYAGEIAAGSGTWLELEVAGGGSATVRFTSGEEIPPDAMRLIVVRLR